MVLRTVAPTDIEWTLQAVIDAVRDDEDTVIVESDGAPKAAVISFERYQQLQALEREHALGRLKEIERGLGDRNDDLSDDEIDELGTRFSRGFPRDLAREGKLAFERDLDK